MTKSAILALLAASLVSLGIFHYKLKPQPDMKEIQNLANYANAQTSWRGQIAPNFEALTRRGNRFKLADSMGKKVVVINFFATWCGPCRQEMPELNRYYNEHKNENFEFIAIDSEEHQDKVESYIDDLKLDFPVAIDEGPIQKQYGVVAFPTTVLIGVDGRVQFYESGAIGNADVIFDSLLAANRKLLSNGKTIAPSDYARESAAHPQLPQQNLNQEAAETSVPQLDERGKRIAAKMDCTCGCDKKVAVCTCNASKKIKGALAKDDFKDMKDDAIIRSLNQQFCPGEM